MRPKGPEPEEAPRRRRPYQRPTVRSQRVLEIHAVGDCQKVRGQGGDCNVFGQLS